MRQRLPKCCPRGRRLSPGMVEPMGRRLDTACDAAENFSQRASSTRPTRPASGVRRRSALSGRRHQAVLGPAGEHAVRLVDAPGHQVVDHHADVRLVAAAAPAARCPRSATRGVDAGDQALRGGLLVAGGAVDLPGQDTARATRLVSSVGRSCVGRNVVVLDGVAVAEDLGPLQARDQPCTMASCTSARQRGARCRCSRPSWSSRPSGSRNIWWLSLSAKRTILVSIDGQ